MFLLHSRNRWSYQTGFEPMLGFCLWILQVDGLHVPPFDQHPNGDGSLRDLGLTAPDWQSWFLRVSDPQQQKRDVEQLQQEAMATYLKAAGLADLEQLRQRYQAEQLKISTEPPLPPVPEFHFYHVCWKGNSAIRNRLIELQREYKQVRDQLDRLCGNLDRAIDKEERRSGIRLYDELQPYATRLPPLIIHYVGYEYPLDYILSPATIVMTVQEGQPDPQEFHGRVLAAVAELAARPGRRARQGPSSYTKIGEPTSPFTAAYRRYARKPSLPRPPRQEVPRLEDAARQVVFEELADEHDFYGVVDLTTVQFLREKNRPGWRLYEITFQEIDGEQHRQIFILQQKEGGSWRFEGGGGSTDMQHEWPELVAPVRDHPRLMLSANWISPGKSHYLLTAHGHVIDNGFHVAQVRLVNEAGQVLEDTVEDGYVFFACNMEQQIQMPMQAELYDQHGKLVWQQTVPDFGLAL